MVWMHAGVMFSIYEDESLSEMCGFCLCYRKYVPFMQWNIPQRASFPFVLQKLPLSAEEFIRRMPIISADGGVMVGSKNTTVFLIDAKSGTVIYAFKSADHSATGDQIAPGKPILRVKDDEEQVESSAVDLEEVEQPLYVIRTDYTVKYVSRKTGKDLWSLRFSEIEASFRCQDTSNFFGGVPSTSDDDFGPDSDSDDELPFNCQRRVVVYRIRDHSLLEPLFVSDGLSSTHLGGRMPFLPDYELYPHLKPADKLPGVHQNDEGNVVLALPSSETKDFGILTLPSGGAGEMYSVAPEVFSGSHLWYFFLCVALLSTVIAFIFHLTPLAVGKKVKLNKQSEEKVQAVMPRKKKARKSVVNKNSSCTDSVETSWRNYPLETLVGDTNGLLENLHVPRGGRKSQLASLSPVESNIDGRKIGKLFVSNKEIAKGSNGTIVLEGTYDGRPVAVKRLVQTHHDVAWKEIQNLIASDCHPNIVRWYGVEYDRDFVYLCLERCTLSLEDLIFSYSSSSNYQKVNKHQDPNYFNNCIIRLDSAMEHYKDYKLWKSNGHPSGQLLKLMRLVEALFFLI